MLTMLSIRFLPRFALALAALALALSARPAYAQTTAQTQPQAATSAATPAVSRAIIRYDAIDHPIQGREGMVVSQRALASKVGAQILAQGGNAVDAAVAVGFALAVNLPRAGNLGGSGFMLIYLKEENKTIALDYRSAAPLSFDIANYTGADGERDRNLMTFGARASGVPGSVAGLHEAWQRYGSMPWKDLLKPAYDMARRGIRISPDLAYVLEAAQGVMQNYEGSLGYYKADGTAYRPGEILKQPDLAWSIRQIMRGGRDAFYTGEIAQKSTPTCAQSAALFRPATWRPTGFASAHRWRAHIAATP